PLLVSFIIPIVKSVTKYSAMIMAPEEVRYHLEKAVFLAKSGRPGPVWLDIPLDVQAAKIDTAKLKPFNTSEVGSLTEPLSQTKQKIKDIIKIIKQSKRPLLLCGHGVWLSGAQKLFRELVGKLKIPIQTSWNGIDIIEESHPLFFGRHNSYGPRYANFIVQNCDCLISIGSRLGLQQIGFNYKAFARNAKKIVVDIDPAELYKVTIKPDVAFRTDAKIFIEQMLKAVKSSSFKPPDWREWIAWCKNTKLKYPTCPREHYIKDGYVDPYVFADTLSDLLSDKALIISGSSGTGFTVTNQVFKIKKGQRFFTSKGLAAMGYGLPSAIGACIASGKKETVTIVGDGGFQLNIQELQTIVHNKLPIKMFIYSNNGYLSIRMTQNTYFNRRLVGSSPSSGVSLPELKKIALAYGIAYYRITGKGKLVKKIATVLELKGPIICEVMINPDKPLLPKLASYKKSNGGMMSRPIEDLAPLLPRDELKQVMLIKEWEFEEDV
ncbi:MAG: thiamine pyrophosphate-binding protein, partial [Candidatus Omnitrophica bacterium]|nr:thiamine pyrophosphate-binding protein [Candidatus Omnitrophota bacterium]